MVRAAIASEQPLEIIGHGTRRQIGQPMATNAVLELSALNAVTSYEPNELIITVQAGAPLADVQSLIDSRNQQFAFEPIDTSALLGASGSGTIGGMIGAGLAGPRRIKAGGVRDHLLGAHAVSGFGDSFKTGGTGGEERHRLRSLQAAGGVVGHAGGHDRGDAEGDAADPRASARWCCAGLDDVTANRAMTAALGSPFDVSGAAHLPNSAFRSAGRRAGRPRPGGPGGHAAAAGRHCGLGRATAPVRSARRWRRSAPWTCCRTTPRRRSGRAVRDVEPFAADGALGAWPVWRIVCPPASGGALGQALARDTGGDVIYDWGGGLIWAALPPKPDAQAALVRQRVEAARRPRTLIRASELRPAQSRCVPSATGRTGGA